MNRSDFLAKLEKFQLENPEIINGGLLLEENPEIIGTRPKGSSKKEGRATTSGSCGSGWDKNYDDVMSSGTQDSECTGGPIKDGPGFEGDPNLRSSEIFYA